MIKKAFSLRIFLTGILAMSITTAAWAWGTDPGGSCCGNTYENKYRMPNGTLANVFPTRKATHSKQKAAPRATHVNRHDTLTHRKKYNFRSLK